ncbi:MAG: hypothetical protein ACRBEQ_03400 [Hyphomonas sp.]
MRKFLILIGILAALVMGAMWWLGQQAVKGQPEEGPVTVETGNPF